MAFPTEVRRATATSAASDATSWTPSWSFALNTAISAGDKVTWLVWVTADGIPTLTVTGWTKRVQVNDTSVSQVCGCWFIQETTSAFAAGSAPSFTVNSSNTQQFSGALYALKAANPSDTFGYLENASGALGSSTNSNPPSITNSSGASVDAFVLAVRGADASASAVATAAPTGYSNLTLAAASGTSGVTTAVAEKQVTIANGGTEDPGTFTNPTEQWVTQTIGVYETGGAPPPTNNSNFLAVL